MKFKKTTRRKIELLFLAFFTLVTISVVATYWGVETQKADALVINLAGRQRMLTQKITWLALTKPDNPELDLSIQLFEQTLHALRDGGPTYYSTGSASVPVSATLPVILPPTTNPALRSDLDQVTRLWEEFQAHISPLNSEALQSKSQVLLIQLDGLVNRYEAEARAKVLRVQIIQAFSFICALLLLGWGYGLTRRQILNPLTQLYTAAQRMAQGQLDQPLPPMGDDELGQVRQALEVMRQEIVAAQRELDKQVAQRTQELMTAFEFSQEIITQPDLHHVLQTVTELARTLVRAKASALCLLDEDKRFLTLTSQSSESTPPLTLHQSIQEAPAYQVVNEGQTVTLCTDCAHCGFLVAHHPVQSAVTPLRSRETILGAMCVVREMEAAFDANETRALALLANVATVAIINARLAEDSRRQAAQTAILTERERLAGELHDNLAQTLGFLNLQADQIQLMLAASQIQRAQDELGKVKGAVEAAYAQVRDALVGLSESLPAGDDFLQRLRAFGEEMGQKGGLQVELHIEDATALQLAPRVQAQALLILREALTNVRKHAQARTVRLWVGRADHQAYFTVEDDGVGFDPQMVSNRGHLGLRLMHARAERSGGTLTVESAPGSGTQVTLCFPLEEST